MRTNDTNNREWEDELKGAPELLKMSEGQPFEAPDGYFDSLPSKIMERIEAGKTHMNKGAVVRPLFKQRRFLVATIAIAAVLVILFIFGRVRNDENKMVAMNYDDIVNSGLVSDLDESLLMETLAEENPYILNSGSNEIEDYLIDSSTEEALLNNL